MRVRPSRLVAGVVAGLLAVTGLLAPVAAVAADITGQMTISKTASTEVVRPGETFSYSITVSCSSITENGCFDAKLIDHMPAEFEIVDVTVGGVASLDPEIDGQDISVSFTEDLGGGQIGLKDSSSGTITITVKVRDDLPYEANGVPVSNDASITSSNSETREAEATVVPEIPLNLDTEASKTLDPASAIASEGTPVSATLGGTNGSNAAVETLVIQDPTDPDASPNPFDYLGFTGFGAVTAPEGATTTTYEVYVDGQWVAASGGSLPAGVDPGDVKGSRVTFAGSIPAGASASVVIDLEHTALATEQSDGFAVENSVTSTVTIADESADDSAEATHTLREDIIVVGASKVFTPDVITPGQSSTVALGASNDSTTPIDTLTVREPSSGAFDANIIFAGFSDALSFPAGAEEPATVTVFVGGAAHEITVSRGETPELPAGVDAADVTGFEVEFQGTILPGEEAGIDFDITAADDVTPLPLDVVNEITVQGDRGATSGSATAEDTLHIYDEQLEVWVDKQLRPNQILAVPGESTTVSLHGGTVSRPDPSEGILGGSTAYADEVVLQDPTSVPAQPGEWWDAFDVTSITQTPIPADAELTIRYFDTTDGEWKVLEGPLAGPDIFSGPVDPALQDIIGGLQFVYTYTGDQDGFAPGTEFAPNFTSELRENSRLNPAQPAFDAENGGLIPNCAASTGTINTEDGGPDATAEVPVCPEIELIPVTPGEGDLIDKEWLTSASGGDKSVISRSGDTIPARLHWSTGGYTFDRVEITDVASPASTPIGQSVFDAFDLVRVEPITDALDPLMKYDQVTAVMLYNGSTWVRASGDPCPTSCEGTFPGYTLTAAEQESTIAVRLVFAENPNRAEVIAGDLDAPQVGTGVARSFSNDRAIDLTFQIRDERRDESNPAPVLAGSEFNLAPQTGVVRNTVNATGFPVTGDPVSHDDSDDVSITDVPLTTTTDKTWAGGPLAVPEPGPPADAYPSGRVTIKTKNTTPARVDSMTITDPASASTITPFDAFDLKAIVRIVEPSGADADETRVTIRTADGTETQYTKAEALALTAAQLADTVKIQVSFGGRIDEAAIGEVALDLRLRPTDRDTDAPVVVTDSPIENQARGDISDLAPEFGREATDLGDANISLTTGTFGVETTKKLSPAVQMESVDGPVTVTLTAQPSGSLRATSMVVTDDDWSFFNAFDFAGISPSFALANPINEVTVEVLTGATFTDTGRTGGSWSTAVDSGTAADAIAWSAALSDGDREAVQGIRFTFERNGGEQWENSSRPLQSIPFLVERRDDLRSGGPVPSTSGDSAPAPGEETAGTFWNTVGTEATSAPYAGDGSTMSATDTEDAEYRHLVTPTAVAVVKAPTGVRPPGRVIPFTITYTNTGETDIHEPIFTDYIPQDADGPQLILDPDRDPSVPPFTFDLTGPAPTEEGWSSMPTNAEVIQTDVSGEKIVFTMPEGTAFGVGQTLTITIPMVFRPGLAAETPVTNTGSITATDPRQNFTECSTTPAPGDPVYECMDDTTVSPQIQPALSARKYVRAEVPAHDPLSERNDYTCSDADADADGFYRSPCIPVSTPGTDVTWRMVLTNSGTLPIDTAVAMDHLPTIGDKGLIVDLPRGSEWPAEFAGGASIVNAPAGAELEMLYTTSDAPCTADLDPLGPGCADDAWVSLDQIGDVAEVRSIQFRVHYTEAPMAPGETLTLQFTTHTQPDLEHRSSYPVAWNTVAVGGQALQGTTPVAIPSTEGRRVGVSYPVGAVEVFKTISGNGAEFAPDSFPGVTFQCVVNDVRPDGTTQVEVTDIPVLTLFPGLPGRVINIPAGAECTVTEADNGQTAVHANTVTVQPSKETPIPVVGTIELENVYELGEFTVEKTVDNPAVDQDGNPITLTDVYEFSASCLFLGEEVLAEQQRTFTLLAGDSLRFADLPAGAECTVTETSTGEASGTSITVAGADGEPVTTAGTTATFTVQPGDDAAITANVINEYATGSLTITKQITGSGAAQWGEGPFDVRLVCTLPNADPGTVYDKTFALTPDAPTVTVDDLPTGAECVVTETDDGGATESTLEPADGTVTVGDAESGAVAVTVTNDFRTGGFQVLKEVTGPGAPTLSDGPFVFTAVCTDEGRTVYQGDIPLVGDGTGAPLVSDAVTGIPVGAECVITETDTGGADAQPAPVTITIEDEVEGEATISTAAFLNRFSAGEATIEKVLTGDAAEEAWATDAVFTVLATCQVDVEGELVTVHSASYEISGGETLPLVDADGSPVPLPFGSHCFIEETNTGGATEAQVNHGSFDNAAVVEADEELQHLALIATNRFDYAGISVTKTLSGGAAEQGQGLTFQAQVVCVIDQGTNTTTVLDETFPIRAGQVVTFDRLPSGADCTVTETDRQNAVSWSISSGGKTGTALTVTLGAEMVTVTIDNRFEPDLATTGGDVSWLPLVGILALVAVLVGLALVLIRRRRHRVIDGSERIDS